MSLTMIDFFFLQKFTIIVSFFSPCLFAKDKGGKIILSGSFLSVLFGIFFVSNYLLL